MQNNYMILNDMMRNSNEFYFD